MWWFPPAAVALIAWGALAFGGEYAWAYAPLLVFASTIGILGLATPVPADRELRRAVVSLALIGGAVGLQLLPLPEPVVAAVSPARSDHDYRALFAATVPTAPGPDEPVARGAWSSSISVSPGRTLLGLTFFIVLSLFFVGCRRALSTARASGVARASLRWVSVSPSSPSCRRRVAARWSTGSGGRARSKRRRRRPSSTRITWPAGC